MQTRLKPHHLVRIVGVGVAAFTFGSYLAPFIFEFDEASDVTRKVFVNIPDSVKLSFYTVIPMLIVYGAWVASYRVKNWERGRPDNRRTTLKNAKRRQRDFRAGVYMQTLLREPGAGIMHACIYFGFIVLLGVTTVLEVNHQVPTSLKFLHGDVYRAYAFIGDFAGLVFTIGIVWAIVRRYGPMVWRPYRIRIKSKPEHAVILATFLAISITGFGAEMFRIAVEGMPEYERWSFIGYPLATLVEGNANNAGWHQFWWVAHVVSFIAFLVILPTTMLRHMFTSPLNMYLKDRDRPKGAMKPMPNLVAGDTELETFGASVIEDFTWKQLLDTDACTMCGRCTSVCPAHATGKPLDPREIVLKTGEVMARTGTPAVSPPIGVDDELTVPANWMFDRISQEELWSCTSCKACDEICPVNIEILDKILDMRRYLTLMDSDFPSELGQAFRSMENSSNPWGMSQGERADWTQGVEGIEIVEGGDPLEAEYLYWVGCAGSFDDKNKKVTQSMAKLMQRADVDFAILGPSEACTGDSARRSGNEYLFQMLATQNVETLNSMGVKKIVTQCPHCFNTLANEYPQLGGHYEVVHHSQFLEWLVDQGRLDLSEAELDERVVYHDSCYLGRHNDVYMAPRKVLGSLGGIQLVEAERNGTKGMCCGAGGARMWMEEDIGDKVNDVRAQELVDTGADRVAVACPFCYVMMDDGVKAAGKEEDEVRVADIAITVLEAIETGEARIQAEAIASQVEIASLSLQRPSANGSNGHHGTNGHGSGDDTPTDDPEPISTDGGAGGVAVAERVDTDVAVDTEVEAAVETEIESEATLEVDAEAGLEIQSFAAAEVVDTETAEPEIVSIEDTEPDDLKVIKGIGPKLEALLHELGIVTYEQVAAFPADYIAKLDDYLAFDGRIERDDWVGQAAELAQSRPAKTAELPELPDETPDNATQRD